MSVVCSKESNSDSFLAFDYRITRFKTRSIHVGIYLQIWVGADLPWEHPTGVWIQVVTCVANADPGHKSSVSVDLISVCFFIFDVNKRVHGLEFGWVSLWWKNLEASILYYLIELGNFTNICCAYSETKVTIVVIRSYRYCPWDMCCSGIYSRMKWCFF